MKKVLISVGVIVIFAAFVFYQHMESKNTSATVQTQITQTAPAQNDSGSTATASPTNSSTSSTPSTPATADGQFKDGSYTGTVANAFYGNIQVEAVISGGKLANVQFLQFPNEPGHTTDVSNQALPQLKSEAIAAQSASVDVVSGATQDSQAFTQSLASALAMAKN